MKNIIFISLLLISLNGFAQQIFDSNKIHTVVPHIGLTEFPIDSTDITAVITAFGDDYQLDDKEEKIEEFLNQRKFRSRDNLKHFPLLLELNYDKVGISFYWLSNDSTQTVRAVKFYSPFKARTAEGLVLNESTMGDVKMAYNDSKILIGGNPPKDITIHEFTEIGIRFRSFLSGYSNDNFPSEEIIENAILDEIYISNYQEKLLIGSL